MPRINPLPGPSAAPAWNTVTSDDFFRGSIFEPRRSHVEQLFEQISSEETSRFVERMTVRQDLTEMVTVKAVFRTGQPTYNIHAPLGELLTLTYMQSSTARNRLAAGNEMVMTFDPRMGRWIITENIATTRAGDAVPPTAIDPDTALAEEVTRLRGQVSRLRDRLSTERREHGETRDALIAAQSDADNLRMRINAIEAEGQLTEQLKTIHRTAVVWRDGRNRTRAKLEAFHSFCAALDSLPAPADVPV